MNPVGRELGFKPPANFAELFGFEFTDEFLDTRLEAYNYGGLEAVKQLDRCWKAMMRKKAAEKATTSARTPRPYSTCAYESWGGMASRAPIANRHYHLPTLRD